MEFLTFEQSEEESYEENFTLENLLGINQSSHEWDLDKLFEEYDCLLQNELLNTGSFDKVSEDDHTDNTTTDAAALTPEPTRNRDLSVRAKKCALNYHWMRTVKQACHSSLTSDRYNRAVKPIDLGRFIFQMTSNNSEAWLESKNFTMGITHWMSLVTTSQDAIRLKLTPRIFGGVKNPENKISDSMNTVGTFGELEVWKRIIVPLFGAANTLRPGKICKPDMNFITTTPDYLFINPKYDMFCESWCMLMLGTNSVVGVGECKTTFGVQSRFSIPKWIPKTREDLYWYLNRDFVNTTRWYVIVINEDDDDDVMAPAIADLRDTSGRRHQYGLDKFEMNMRVEANRYFMRPFHSEMSRQMIAECMTIMDFVEYDTVTLAGFLPSVAYKKVQDEPMPANNVDKNDLSLKFCAFFTVEIRIDIIKQLFDILEKPILKILSETLLNRKGVTFDDMLEVKS
ncbi:hypothetical protein EGW08_023202 [Elysia chlorotica]|uniref:Uncharacterized protein n=1 Tax=Elysia chlorotica TaxID=188477 RepID=A0A3S0ZJQ5_ELYCH|nr:hypothetical protein EGW08_023202 [Elysia chlorotica]